MYSLKTTSIGRADNFRIGGEKQALNDKQKKRKNSGWKRLPSHVGWLHCSYCNGVVATVAGRRENSESELNTWRSAAIFAPVLA